MKRSNKTPPPPLAPLMWTRADPATLASFDPRTKVCSMNCGPHADHPRSHAERAFLCPECHTVEVPTMKPHEQRELVNDLTDIARKFHGSEQLRDRIANRLASRPPAPARDASVVELWRDLVGAVRFLEVDHALDGFPAVRMSMLSAMASELERLAAEVDELHALRDRLGDLLSRTAELDMLARNLANIRDGEVLVMHWGVRSRREPFAGILEPLIAGLQERGFCFATLPPEGRR